MKKKSVTRAGFSYQGNHGSFNAITNSPKKKKEKKKKNTEPTFLTNLLSVYWFLFNMLFPFVIALLPVIPTVVYNNPLWLLGLIITIPLCFTMAIRVWQKIIQNDGI